MKNLRDELMKAGLVSKKDARRAAAEQARERKAQQKKHSVAQAEAEKERAAAQAQKEQAKRERDRAIERERRASTDTREERFRWRDLIESSAIPIRGGDRRWHFVCPDRVIRALTLPDSVARDLTTGAAAVVASPQHGEGVYEWAVVPRATLQRLGPQAQHLVLFHNE